MTPRPAGDGQRLLTSEQILARGIEDSREAGKRPGPDVERRVVPLVNAHQDSTSEPLDAA